MNTMLNVVYYNIICGELWLPKTIIHRNSQIGLDVAFWYKKPVKKLLQSSRLFGLWVVTSGEKIFLFDWSSSFCDDFLQNNKVQYSLSCAQVFAGVTKFVNKFQL